MSDDDSTFNRPLGAAWQYRRRPNYWGLILISAILILGSVGILKIAEDAIARQDRIQQEEIQ